jgi:hypothetical protein
MKNSKEIIGDWKSRLYLWIPRLAVYFGYLVGVVLICYCLFHHLNLFHTEADSARYMLSALVQSQAAIVAIVITLTLIAVQLTASTYSPRVITTFRKNPDMWLILSLYVLSIIYGFIVLKLLKEAEDKVMSQGVIGPLEYVYPSFEPTKSIPFFITLPTAHPISPLLEFHVSFALWLGIFTLVALFPYMLNIINLLKPKTIIDRLSAGITKKNTLNYLKYIEAKEGTSEEDETSTEEEQIPPRGDIKEASKEDEIMAVDDPIQPIMDIITRSLMNHDITTTREGLEKIVEQAIEIINSEGEDEEKERKITEHFCKHLQRVGRLAVSKTDEEPTMEVIENLKKIGKDSAEKGHGDAVQEVAIYIKNVGIAAAENKLIYAARLSAIALKAVGTTAANNRLVDEAGQIVPHLEEVGKAAANVGEKLERVVCHAIWGLKAVGVAAKEATNEKEPGSTTREAAMSLGVVGKIAAKKELCTAKNQAVKALECIINVVDEMVVDEMEDFKGAKNQAESAISDIKAIDSCKA